MSMYTIKQVKDEFLDKFQEHNNVTVEAAEGFVCVF